MKNLITNTVGDRFKGERPGVMRAAAVAVGVGVAVAAGTYRLLRSAE
jgi:hypothetical protein